MVVDLPFLSGLAGDREEIFRGIFYMLLPLVRPVTDPIVELHPPIPPTSEQHGATLLTSPVPISPPRCLPLALITIRLLRPLEVE